MKVAILLFLSAFAGGCVTDPVREMNLKVLVTAPDIVDIPKAEKYANALASITGMRMSFNSTVSGNRVLDSIYRMEFVPVEGTNIKVAVECAVAETTLFVTIEGDIESAAALNVSKRAQELAKNYFPNSRLVLFKRYHSLFGP